MTVRTAQEPGTRCVTLAHVVESLVGMWAEDNSVSCPGLTTLGGASWPGFAEGCIPEKPRGALRKPRLRPPVGSSTLSGGPGSPLLPHARWSLSPALRRYLQVSAAGPLNSKAETAPGSWWEGELGRESLCNGISLCRVYPSCGTWHVRPPGS